MTKKLHTAQAIEGDSVFKEPAGASRLAACRKMACGWSSAGERVAGGDAQLSTAPLGTAELDLKIQASLHSVQS